jgi:hypothetical protein
MYPAVKCDEPSVEVRLVRRPRHPIDSRRGLPLQVIEARPHPVDRDVMKQGSERCPRVPTCNFPHTDPAPCVRGAVVCSVFSLVSRLPQEPPQANRRRRSGPSFVGTVRPSDCPSTCVVDVRLIAFSTRPGRSWLPGVGGSPVSRARSIHACKGSQTARSRTAARGSTASRVPAC